MYTGPKIITDGLVFSIDAGSARNGAGVINLLDGGSCTVNNPTKTDNSYFTNASSVGYISYPSTDTFSIFSAEVMFKSTDTSQDGYCGLITKDLSGSFGNIAMAGGAAGDYVRFGFYNSGTVEVNNQSYLDLEAGDDLWYHYLGTFDGSTMRLYRNSVMIAELTGITKAPIGNTSDIRVFNRTAGDFYYTGDIGIARLYNRALTSDEVIHNYEVAKQRFKN